MQTRIAAAWRNTREDSHHDLEPAGAKEKQRRGEQWRRTMLIAEVLMGAVDGIPVQDLKQRIEDRTGEPLLTRTIHRDVELLESLGLAEKAGDREGTIRFCARHHARCRAVLSAVTLPEPDSEARRPASFDPRTRRAVERRQGATQAALDRLPPPWAMTERQMRAANEAARILALIDNDDSAWVGAVLVYQLGAGWQLRRPGADAPSRHAYASAISTEEQIDRAEDAIHGLLADEWDAFDDERWELTDGSPRDLRRAPR